MEKLLWKEKLSYGIGAYGKDFIYNMIAAFLMIFYTDVVWCIINFCEYFIFSGSYCRCYN